MTAGANGSPETSLPSLDRLNKKWGARAMSRVHHGSGGKAIRHLPPKALKIKGQFAVTYKITFNKHTSIQAVITDYAQNEHVEYAEPNYLAFTSATIPSDPSFTEQWALDNTGQTDGTPDADIDAPEAWDITTGGTETVIAVVDTGIDWDHPDLSANIWTNAGEIPGDTIDNDGNGFVDDVRGWDFVSADPIDVFEGEDAAPPDNDPMDIQGHGTHCAGIIGAAGNNGLGIAGVNWNARLMAVRAGYKDTAGNGSLQHDDIAAAIIYATDNGADIINMSFGGAASETLKSALDYAYAAGVTLVASAGNNRCKCIQYPAAYGTVLAISSFDHNDRKAVSSNYGDWIDLASPGVGIYSTYAGDTYATLSGTSMAAPQVCGVAGLILSQHPDFIHEDIRQVLRTSADDVSAAGWDEESGYGRVNAFNALQVHAVCRARITSPAIHEEAGGVVAIRGTASGADFSSYDLYCGEGTNPASWTLIGSTSYSAVSDDLLGSWDTTSLPRGYHTVKLVVRDADLNEFIDRRTVMVTNVTIAFSPPLQMNVLRFGDTMNLTGTISATGFQQYRIEYGEGTDPASWQTAGISLANGGLQEVVEGEVGSWNTSILPQAGEYSVRVTVHYGPALLEEQRYILILDPSIKAGWPKTFDSVSPVAVGYLDRDLTAEVLAGINTASTLDPATAAWDHTGADVDGWPVPFSGESLSTIATGDIDADGKAEAVLGYSWTSDQVYLFNHDGTPAAGWPRTGEKGYPYEGTPVLSDIDHDGDLEIFAGGGKIFAWHHDGTTVAGWPKELQGSSPAIADLDGDGNVELAVIALNELYVFDRLGNSLPGWPVTLEDLTYHPPVIGDIDHDGTADIIVAVTNVSKVYAFTSDGSVKTGWPQDYYGYPPNYGMALGDTDGDGYLEIFLASASKVNAWDHQGVPLPGWPVYLPGVYWIRGLAAPVLGDINGDGTAEMVIGAEIFQDDYEKLFAYNREGTAVDGWPKPLRSIYGYGIMSPPVLTDLDSDGYMEVAVSSNADDAMATDLYVWDLPYRYDHERIEWGMLANDAWHTGAFGDHIPPVTNAHPGAGTLTSPQFITLRSNEPATIYYTTDGSLPTAASPVYSSPLPVTTGITLRFFAIDAAGNREIVKTEVYAADLDGDGINAENDNCPLNPNGPNRGTCTAGTSEKIGRPCMLDADCGTGGFCSMDQEDTYPAGGDGIGDACYLCEADFDLDGDVDGTDASAFKADFGRTSFIRPCQNGNPCSGDFTCDRDVDGSDAAMFKLDFGRSIFNKPCPARVEGEWCVYQ